MKSRSNPPDGWAEVTVGDAGEDLVDMKMFIEDDNLIVMIRTEDGQFAASEDGGETFRELIYAEQYDKLRDRYDRQRTMNRAILILIIVAFIILVFSVFV